MKICPQCHSTLDNDTRFCNTCGANVQDVIPVQETVPVQPAAVEEKVPFYKNKKILTIGGIALAVVAIAIILIIVLSPSGGAKSPEEAAEIYVKASVKLDVDDMISIANQAAKNDFVGKLNATDKEVKAALEESLSDMSAESREYYNSIKVTRIKITDTVNYDNSELQDYIEEYREATEDYKCKITELVEVTLEVTLEYEGDYETDEMSVDCVCIDGRWYIAQF